MCVCVCIQTRIYIYTHIYIYIHTHIYIYIYTQTRIYICIFFFNSVFNVVISNLEGKHPKIQHVFICITNSNDALTVGQIT